jgi:flagellar hook assembly protein FlgD
VSLKIYDVAGALVRELLSDTRTAGAYDVKWDGRDTSGQQVASGVYFYKLTAGAFTQTRKMVLLK